MTNKLSYLLLVPAAIIACREEHSAGSPQKEVAVTENRPAVNGATNLTSSMKRALDQYAPGFVRFTPGDYAANTNTVSRVDADFNGDNIPDVALYGHDKARELLLVLLSASDTVYRVSPIIENRLEPFPNGVSIGLGVHPSGPLDLPELLRGSETPKLLKYPAIELTLGREAGELHYWNGTKFVKVVTGD